MKPKILLSILCGLLTTTLTAQQTENNKILRGKVLFQNSNYTPAVGVSVSGKIKLEKEENTNSVYTDSQGTYQLKFPLARKGHPVKLTIGKEDEKGQELEVVNETEISLCRIPANANQEFKIIVCPKGSRDIAARKYYNILKNSAELAYEKMQEEFRALINSQNKDYKTIQEVADDLTKLQNQLSDSIALYKEAMAIASINKDGVNERVLEYLELLDEGISIQEARKTLSISKASKDMEKGIKLFRAGVKELQERARASAAVFDYQDAAVCYDTLIAKAEKLNIDQLELSGYYLKAGDYQQDNGNYIKALHSLELGLKITESLLDSLDIKIAYAYSAVALVLKDLGQFKEALDKEKKSFKILEKRLEPDHPDIATSYNNLSVIYQGLGLYKKAFEAQKQALRIRKEIFKPDHLILGVSYNNMASISLLKGDLQETLIYLKMALSIYESNSEAKHPDLATVYSNLAAIYSDLGNQQDALKFQLKDIKIRKSIFRENHPSLADSYGNLSIIYLKLNNYEEALQQQLNAVKINESVLPSNHLQLASSYNNLATNYLFFNRLEEALSTQKKAIEIQKIVLGNNHITLASSLNILASILMKEGKLLKAKENQEEAIRIYESQLDSLHPYLSTSYYNLGNIYHLMNDYELCLVYLKKAYYILQKSLTEEHPNTKQVFNALLFVYKDMSKTQYKSKKYQDALMTLNTVTKYQKDAEAWNLKGNCYFYLKKYPHAISAYQKALELDSTFKANNYYHNIGQAYAKNRQFPEAKAAFTEYQKLFPNEGKPYRNLAMFYALQNQREEALNNLKKAISLGYADKEWLQTDDSMDNLRDEPEFKALLEKLKE